MARSTFSERNGLGETVPVRYRDELPDNLKKLLLELVVRSVGAGVVVDRAGSLFNPFGIADFPIGPPIPGEHDPEASTKVKTLLTACTWYQLFDVIEAVLEDLDFYEEELASPDERGRAWPLRREITRFFEHAGIGWQVEQHIVARFDHGFDSSMEQAQLALKFAGRETAAKRLREAVGDLSRRPAPDSAGAIIHAMGAMEALARDITKLEHKTLGDIIKRRPPLFPPALGAGLEKFWGFASEEARHVSEGREPSRKDAELVVRVAAALIVYISDNTSGDAPGA